MKKKLHITIFHSTFIYTGGGERIVLGQIDGLKKRGYKVDCFTPVFDKKKCYPDIIDKYNIKTFLPQLPNSFPLRYAIILILTCLLMPFLCLRFKRTDVFIGENQPGTWLAFIASKILRKPYIVYTCHPNKMVYTRKFLRKQLWKNQQDFYWLSIFFEPFKTILKLLDKISFSSTKNPIIINGSYIGGEFEKIYHLPWVDCPCGVNSLKKDEIFKNFVSRQKELKVGKYEIKKPYILFTTRHEVWKSIDLAILAFSKVLAKVPQINFIIPGPYTPHTESLKKLSKKLGISEKVFFIEEVSQKDLAELYKNSSVYVFTSKKEDLGIVMMEAMSYGIPVVAWDSAGPTDIVVNKKTGFLVEPFDVTKFSEKIIYLLKNKNKRDQMGLESWKRAIEVFSWKRHIDILERNIKTSLKNENVTF